MEIAKIERINELYRKSKAEGLTEEEKKEQQILRREYVDAFKRDLRGQLNNISIKEKDGSITNLGEKYGQKKAMTGATWFAIIFQSVLMIMMIFCDLTKVSVTNINLITIVFLTVFALLNGVKSITNNMVVPMIADCTDYEYTISGHFVPGIMGALFSFIDKSFSALGTFFVGISLSLIGYSKVFPQVGDELTQPLKWMTIFFYCIIPIIGWLITLFAMRYYKLDKAAMKNLYSLKGGKE